jgi:hypothetical protein
VAFTLINVRFCSTPRNKWNSAATDDEKLTSGTGNTSTGSKLS